MIQRIFVPGSKWLYFNLYTGVKSADRLLADIILPFTEVLLRENAIEEWFFIRYTDPKFHLRVRLKLTSGESFNRIMALFHHEFESLMENGLVTDVVIDCYRRELERYGEETMELSERLFSVDSTAVTRMIALLRENGDADESRWLLALNLVDDMLVAAGYDLEEKYRFIERVDSAFREEFGIDSAQCFKPLNSKYRDYRKKITETLDHKNELYSEILNSREQQLSLIFTEIKNKGGRSMEELMPSYTHMTLNRLFRSNNRLCELVIYYLMYKHYASCAALEKIKTDEKLSLL